MAREMEALKARMENSAQSSSAVHGQLGEAQGAIRLLEDEKKLLSAKLTNKEKEIDELEEEMRKLRRQLEVPCTSSLTALLIYRMSVLTLMGPCRECVRKCKMTWMRLWAKGIVPSKSWSKCARIYNYPRSSVRR